MRTDQPKKHLTFNLSMDILDKMPQRAASLSALAAINGTAPIVYLDSGGRSGPFFWSSANNANNVTNDPRQAVYVAGSGDPTGAAGAYVRLRDEAVLHSRWFDTAGNSTGVGVGTNDAAALQALFNAALYFGENIIVDKGKYRCSSPLTFDKSGINGTAGFVPSIFGHGYGDTRILFDAGVSVGINVIGGSSGAIFGSFFRIQGLHLVSSGKTGIGLQVDKVAFLDVDSVFCMGWSDGFKATDFISSKLNRLMCYLNIVGMRMLKGTSSIPINAVNMVSCWIAGNDRCGAEVTSAATLNISGGSVEGNGADTIYSSGNRGGLRLLELSGGGHNAGFITGVYFENNAGVADLMLFTSTATAAYGKALAIHGNSFTRVDATNYTEYNIYINHNTTVPVSVSLSGNGHGNLGSAYPESSARPYVKVTDPNAAASLIDDGSNFYEAAVATPKYWNRNRYGILQTTPNGIGYAAGAGNSATQATSRTTGVTIDAPCGAIVLFTTAGSATATSFTVTNSTVSVEDTIVVCQRSGVNKYEIHVTAVANGSFEVTFKTTGGVAVDTPVFNFALIKATANPTTP